jgi:hypothetical protein
VLLAVPPPPPPFHTAASSHYEVSRRALAHTVRPTSALFESDAHAQNAQGERVALLLHDDGLWALRGEGARSAVRLGADGVPVVLEHAFHLSAWGRWRDDEASADARIILSIEEFKQYEERAADAADGPVHTWHVPFGFETRARVYPCTERNSFFEPHLPEAECSPAAAPQSPRMQAPSLFHNSARVPMPPPRAALNVLCYLWHPSLGLDVRLRCDAPAAATLLGRLSGGSDFAGAVGAGAAELRRARAAAAAEAEHGVTLGKSTAKPRAVQRKSSTLQAGE